MPLIRSQDREDSTVRGEDHGASVSLIIDESEPGTGPRLHRHAYDETWVVEEGKLTFTAGEQTLEAGPGDVVIIPPGVAHKFTNSGLVRSRIICIHASPAIVGEWLE